MKLTRFERDLLEVSILNSIEGLEAHPVRKLDGHKDTFDKAIAERKDLLAKILPQVTIVAG
jgi:hypothetical protein